MCLYSDYLQIREQHAGCFCAGSSSEVYCGIHHGGYMSMLRVPMPSDDEDPPLYRVESLKQPSPRAVRTWGNRRMGDKLGDQSKVLLVGVQTGDTKSMPEGISALGTLSGPSPTWVSHG